MSEWATRIKSRMKELDLTQEELAEKLSITRGAVTHYLGGRRVPPLKQFEKIASALKVDASWLQFGVGKDPVAWKQTKPTPSYHHIIILTWEQVAKSIDVSKLKLKTSQEYITDFYTCQKNWYGLRVKGDSMTSLTGGKSFLEGNIVVINPDAEAKHGDFVVAITGKAKEATLKQYVVDAGIKYLKPLNVQYPITKFEKGTTIVGVVKNVIS